MHSLTTKMGRVCPLLTITQSRTFGLWGMWKGDPQPSTNNTTTHEALSEEPPAAEPTSTTPSPSPPPPLSPAAAQLRNSILNRSNTPVPNVEAQATLPPSVQEDIPIPSSSVNIILHRRPVSVAERSASSGSGGLSIHVPSRPQPKKRETRFDRVSPEEREAIKAELRIQVAKVSAPDTRDQPRLSNVRYSQNVRAGKHKHTQKLLGAIRAAKGRNVSIDEAVHHLSEGILSDRQRLDILRNSTNKSKSKKGALRLSNKIPTYYSPLYGRRYYFREEDLEESSCRGVGPGGQATNRRAQTSVVHHVPTGITVKCHTYPSLHINRKMTRMKLHLEVERRLLGDASLLGRREKEKKKKGLAALRKSTRLKQLGKSVMNKAAHYFDVYPFLSGTSIMAVDNAPSELLAAEGLKNKAISVMCALETLCMCWWECLSRSFPSHWSSPQTVESPVLGVEGGACERVKGWVIGASKRVPCWFCHFFPIVPPRPAPPKSPPASLVALATMPLPAALPTTPKSTDEPLPTVRGEGVFVDEEALMVRERQQAAEDAIEIEKAREAYKQFQKESKAARMLLQTVDYHIDQLEHCSRSAEVRLNVCRALRGVLEAFGLRTNCEEVEALRLPGEPEVPLKVSQDATLWPLHKDRLYCPRTGKLTDMAGAVLPHAIASLSVMGFDTEHKAILTFLRRKGTPDPTKGRKGAPWARELISKTDATLQSVQQRASSAHTSSSHTTPY